MINSAALKKITGARFRANSDYEIVLLDRLPEAYRKELEAGTETDTDIYGVLWPRPDKGLTPKTICHETALLLYSLLDPGALPAYVHARFGAECNQAIAELVLDGVLEIDDGNGRFVSGPGAHGLISDSETLELGVGKIPELSRSAMHYGQLVTVSGSAQLSARLYAYNTVPISAKWRATLPTCRAVERFLGFQTGSSLRRLLTQRWVRVGDTDGEAGWLMWRMQGTPTSRTPSASPERTYKLYVSPRPESLPEVLPRIVAVFADYPVPAFKIGKDCPGLLRPDKIVAYFGSFDDVAALAGRLSAEIADCPAQGTPFTAGIGETGLLSWGMDPPREERMPGQSQPESWRSWITNRLAVALLAARHRSVDIEPWRFALQRLRVEGVDTKTWAPNHQVWSCRRSG